MKIGQLNKKETLAVKEFCGKMKILLKQNLVNIRLFGSKARGDFRKESDIDILLVLKKKSWDLIDKIYDVLIDVEIEHNSQISLKIYSEAEFNRIKDYETFFYKNITKEGVSL